MLRRARAGSTYDRSGDISLVGAVASRCPRARLRVFGVDRLCIRSERILHARPVPPFGDLEGPVNIVGVWASASPEFRANRKVGAARETLAPCAERVSPEADRCWFLLQLPAMAAPRGCVRAFRLLRRPVEMPAFAGCLIGTGTSG